MVLIERNLNVDEIVAGAYKWDDKYFNTTIHAVELYEHSDKVRRTVKQFLSCEYAGAFKLTNPFSKQIWLRELLMALLDDSQWPKEQTAKQQEDDGDPLPLATALETGSAACALVTFTHKDWVCPDTAIEFDLMRAKQKVRNALQGLSFIAAFEVAYYVNEKWEKNNSRGNLVSLHCHAVLWAPHWSRLARRRKKIKKRFIPILGSKTGVRFDELKRIDDVVKVVRYQAKMPFYGYRTVTNAAGKRAQKLALLSYICRYRLFEALRQYKLLDFWLAGGDGKAIVSSARHQLREHRRRLHRKKPVVLQSRVSYRACCRSPRCAHQMSATSCSY